MAFEDPLNQFSFEERRPVLDLLEPGEEILWADRPELTAVFGRSTLSILFGLGWTALVIYLFFFHQGGQGHDRWIAIPFVLAGLFITFSPLKRLKRVRGTLYALTERRALILEPKRTRIFPVVPGMSFRLKESGGGAGDILFDPWAELGAREKPATADHPKGASIRFRSVGFIDVDPVHRPHQLLQQLTNS